MALRLLAEEPVAQVRGGFTAEVTPAVGAASREIERDPNNEWWLGELDGAVIAMLQLTLSPGTSRGAIKWAPAEAVHVRADLHSPCIGEELMRHVEQRARAVGCALVQLTSDRQRQVAHRSYQRLGYLPSTTA